MVKAMRRNADIKRSAARRSENFFHAHVLDFEAEFFVKADRFFVVCPDVERDVVTALFPRVGENVFVKALADVLSAHTFVNAEIVDVERFYVGHIVFAEGPKMDAERVADDRAAAFGDENGRLTVRDDLKKFFVGVLFLVRLEKVGANVAVDIVDLIKQSVDRFDVAFFGASYFQTVCCDHGKKHSRL